LVKQKEKDLIPIYEVALEMLSRGYKIKNIDIMKSTTSKFIIENNYLIPSFSTIDGLGHSVADSIVEARKNKVFSSKTDLIERTKISKNIIEQFEKLHIIDDLEEDNQLSLF
jgi:DNA polymerase-3 subunit alpha (Gram-positive type)